MKNRKFFIASILVFIVCICVGLGIARHKTLWMDEFYSQVYSIADLSYLDQFLGRIPEGNNAPLFYILQKSFLQLAGFQTPVAWQQLHWQSDHLSQIILRLSPVFFMSLSVGLVFYYFFSNYSLGIAFLSLFIYVSSYMLWAYWAEARPYALLVFLTTVQSILFLKKMDRKSKSDDDRLWIGIAGINILLSLTSILSFGEVLAVSVLWWVYQERDWRKYIAISLIPLAVFIFYYSHAPKYHFFFGLSPEQLIRDNMSRERFDVIFIFLIFLAIHRSGEILRAIPYFIFMVLVLASSVVILCVFALHAKLNQGFAISSRYFIYLTPIGVIASTILIVAIIKSAFKNVWLRCFLIGIIAVLLIQHFIKIVPKAVHSMILVKDVPV